MSSGPTRAHIGSGSGPVRTAIKLVVSAGLMVFLLRRISVPELLRLVRTLDAPIMTVAVVTFFTSNVLGAFQWHQLLRAGGIELRFARSFRFYFVGLFFNNFLPANIGGDAVKVYDVSRIGTSVYQVIAVTLLDRLLGIFSLCGLAVLASIWLMRADAAAPYPYYLFIFAACMVPGLGLYFIKPLGNLLRRIVRRIRPFSLDARITSILDHLSHFKARKPLVARLLALSAIIQTLRVATHMLVGIALGLHLGADLFAQFFVFVPLLSLAMIPPVTINGLGVREGLGIVLFAAAGLGETDAFTLEFLTYVVSVLVSLVGLIFFLARSRGRGEAAHV